MNNTEIVWALVVGLWVVLFAGTPDLMDAIIHFLMK
jgi:hypothetical protein